MPTDKLPFRKGAQCLFSSTFTNTVYCHLKFLNQFYRSPIVSSCCFCPYILAQGRLGYQIMEELEGGNDGTDLGNKTEEEIWDRSSQRQNCPEKGGASVTCFWTSIWFQIALDFEYFLDKPPYSPALQKPSVRKGAAVSLYSF